MILATLRKYKTKGRATRINRIKKILDEKIKGTRIEGKVRYEGFREDFFKNMAAFYSVSYRNYNKFY